MNKSGHLAFGLMLGSIYLAYASPPEGIQGTVSTVLALVGVAIGSLMPDIDHKTSTVSRLVSPFSAATRRKLRYYGTLSVMLGIALWLIHWAHDAVLLDRVHDWPKLQSVLRQLLKSSPLIAGAGVILLLLAKLRDLVLLGVGSWMLYAYMLYDLHWFVAIGGLSLMVIPLVKHRGVIHTPEFALTLTIGALSLVEGNSWYWVSFAVGLVVGWWAHLAGDLFGSDGIHSLFVPWIKVALHLFSNGGHAERWIVRGSLVITAMLWLWIGMGNTLPSAPEKDIPSLVNHFPM